MTHSIPEARPAGSAAVPEPMPIPTHLGLMEILAMANRKSAPFIKRRRTVNAHRAIYSVRSDFLYHYTDNWFRNRNADAQRVREIMRSIEREGEVDHRIYAADIRNCPVRQRLLVFDGNHRREALCKLYTLKNKTFWVDLDVLMDVDDDEVIAAFRRVNQSICLPESYLEDTPEDSDSDAERRPDAEDFHRNKVAYCERLIAEMQERWPNAIVDKTRTQIPYCTKNDMANFLVDYFRLGGRESELMIRMEMLNEEHRLGVHHKSIRLQSIARALNCFVFTEGIGKLRQSLLPSSRSF